MGIFTRSSKQQLQRPDGDDFWYTPMGGSSNAGVAVDESTALGSTAVFCAIYNICAGIAMLPLHTYRRRTDGRRRKEIDRDHYLYGLLHDDPNPEQTSYTFREWMQANLLVRGNAYAWKEMDRNGRTMALWPLRADRMQVRRDSTTNRLEYQYYEGGKRYHWPREQVLHIPGFQLQGLVGLCVTEQFRDSIGLTIAEERYGAKFFQNGGYPGGVLQHPSLLDDDSAERLRKSWEDVHTGLSNAHKVAILEEGMEWKQTGIPPGDAQMIEQRRFQIDEVARIFNISPHLLKELGRMTFSNIEHLGIEHIQYTLGPWHARWEQAIRKWVYTEADRRTHFSEFVVDGLLRGDTQSRMQAHRTAIFSAMRTPNEARDLENDDPKVGGDRLFVPASMAYIDADGGLRIVDRNGEPKLPGAEREPDPATDGERDTQSRKRDEDDPEPVDVIKEWTEDMPYGLHGDQEQGGHAGPPLRHKNNGTVKHEQ